MKSTKQLLVLLAAVAAIGISTGTAAADIPEVVKIGGVFDLTGWSPHGEEAKYIAEVAVEDFNAYLEKIGADWSIEMSSENAEAKAETARQKVLAFKGKGVDLLIGMAWSSHLTTAKGYIDSNNMLVISHASQALTLSVPDSIFRLVPSDDNQVPAVIAMLERADIQVLLPVIRDDPWGNGMVNGMTEAFNGTMAEAIKFNPEAVDLSVEAGFIDEKIGELIDEYGAESVGVLYVGEKFELLIESMAWYENPSDVRWFSTTNQSKNSGLVENAIMLKFVQDTRLETTRSVTESNIQAYVDEKIYEKFGVEPSIYTYPSYDTVWLLGTTILHAQTTDPAVLTEILPLVAKHSYGAVGHLEVNENGDIANNAYAIWTVVNGEWVQNGTYDPASQSIK